MLINNDLFISSQFSFQFQEKAGVTSKKMFYTVVSSRNSVIVGPANTVIFKCSYGTIEIY